MFPIWANVLLWAEYIGKHHGIIVVNVCFDTTNGLKWRKDKFIMGCERDGNYKSQNSSQVTFSRKFKCPFMLRYVSSDSDRKVTVR